MVMRTLEAALAIMFVLSSIVFLFPGNDVRSQSSYSAYNCLRQMDNEGNLRYYAKNGMENELNIELRSCIPVSYNYTAKICASASCSSQLPGKTVFLSSYMIAGWDTFSPAVVNVWVWSK